jgi:hypothetical protein
VLNKTKFLELVRDPDLIEEKDLPKLDELAAEHPYSQVIHVLNLKGRKNFNKPDFQESLHLASTYVYDRSILKSLIEGSEAVVQSSPTATSPEPDQNDQAVEETSDFSWIQQDDEDEDIFIDEIPQDFQLVEQEPAKTTDQDQIVEPPPEKEQTDFPEEEILQPEPPSKQPPVTKIEEIGEDTVEAKEDVTTNMAEDPLAQEIEAGSIHAELMQNLNQLQENKQQLEKSSEKNGGPKNRQEQIEIIDNFIKNSPVLSKPNLSAESEGVSQDDLSKSSTELSEEMVSENLAKIYLKQGKAKDAEKIYKKLIRKFPQKKPYFAGQIEKIKKK